MRLGDIRMTLMPFSKSSLIRLVSSIRSVKLLPPTDMPYTKAFSITFTSFQLDYKGNEKKESSQGCGPQCCELCEKNATC